MKKLLLLTALLAGQAMADYVSPTEYKGWSCEDMKVEWDYQVLLGSDLFTDALERGRSLDNAPSAVRAADYSEALRKSGDVDLETRALEEAMRRANCKDAPKAE